eukprot:6212866-Pleurochrysis_carterae.AAC.9
MFKRHGGLTRSHVVLYNVGYCFVNRTQTVLRVTLDNLERLAAVCPEHAISSVIPASHSEESASAAGAADNNNAAAMGLPWHSHQWQRRWWQWEKQRRWAGQQKEAKRLFR